MPLLKNLPSNKIAKIADVLEMVSSATSVANRLSCLHTLCTHRHCSHYCQFQRLNIDLQFSTLPVHWHFSCHALAIVWCSLSRCQYFAQCTDIGWLGSRVVGALDSGAVGPGFQLQSQRCRVTVLGKLFTPIVQRNW